MRIWLGLVLVVACAGNPRRDEALHRAELARARGEYVAEALALRDACAAASDDRDLCTRARKTWDAAHARAIADARTVCAGESIDACLASVGAIRRLVPDDPTAAELAESASRRHLARCFAAAPAWQTSIESGVELVRCLDARAPQIALPIYTAQLQSTRVDVRDQLLRIADHAVYRDRHGALAELLGAAACLAPSPALVDRLRSARAALADRARASIDLRLAQTTLLPDLCATAVARLDGRAACGDPRPNAPQLTLVGELTVLPIEHSAHETSHQKDYVAGIIRYDNPAYPRAVHDETEARRAREQAESQFRRDEADCRSAESALTSAGTACSSSCAQRDERDRACNRRSASESTFRQREADYESARRRLGDTPAVLEREDIRTAVYIVRHHTWRAGWRGQIRSDGQNVPLAGEVSTTDDETSGAPVAGVPADPQTFPGTAWQIRSIRDAVAAKLAETAAAALVQRAADLVASCPAPAQWTPDWLDCRARTQLWSNQFPEDALLRLLAEAQDAVRAGAPAWPPVRCAR